MVAALTVIDKAYSLLGVKAAGEALSADDSAYGLAALNSMIDSWNTQNLFILSQTTVTATVSTQTATIGAGQTFNVTRPVEIRAGAYMRISGADYPLRQFTAVEYNSLPFKSSSSTFPEGFYYQAGLPTGLIYFYPIPNSVSITLPVDSYLSAFADLTTNYVLAPGYQRAIELSLAEEMSPGIRPLDPQIARLAVNARRVIRRSNTVVPLMGIDANIPRGGYCYSRGY